MSLTSLGNNANLARCPLPLGEPGVSNNYQLASPIYVKDSVNLNVVRPLTVPFPALRNLSQLWTGSRLALIL